jgi:hypothetical protein
MLGIQGEPQGPGIGDFPLGPRTPVADINRRAMYEAQSSLRQQFDPLPPGRPPVAPGLQAPAQPMQMPRGQGMFGRMGIQQAAAATPMQAPAAMAPDQADWRQAADTEASRTFRPLPMGEEAPRRGLEPPSARDVLTDEYLQQRGPNYRFEGGYTGPRPGTPDQRGDRDNWQPVPQPPQSAYRRADPPAPTIEEGAWTAAMARVRARDKGDPDPTGLRERADRELAPLRNRVRADQNRQRIAEDLTARYRSSRR